MRLPSRVEVEAPEEETHRDDIVRPRPVCEL